MKVALRGQELASERKLAHSEHCSDQESEKRRQVAVAGVSELEEDLDKT